MSPRYNLHSNSPLPSNADDISPISEGHSDEAKAEGNSESSSSISSRTRKQLLLSPYFRVVASIVHNFALSTRIHHKDQIWQTLKMLKEILDEMRWKGLYPQANKD